MTTANLIKTARAMKAATADAAAAYLVARARAEVLREEFDGLTRRLLAEGDYRDEMTGERVTDPRYDWTIEDGEWQKIHTIRLAYVVENHGPEWGDRCPALCAEQDQRDAEDALLAAAATVTPGIDRVDLDNRQSAIDSIMGLACARAL